MNLSQISSTQHILNVMIEISAHSFPIKYEYNQDIELLQVDRFLSTSMIYPCNYGFIPNTRSGDGDPIDILVITQWPLNSNVMISVRPIGVLLTTDEKGQDEKILSVPSSQVDNYYDNIFNYSDLPKNLLDRIVHFFTHYKDLEKEKAVIVGEWMNAETAKRFIQNSIL
ncbi:inorganic diphosphatase [Wolbachia endosymbiont of Howardula sp.]|uniref:inorganic diphosphatase n=1 Tax=Wolbachia endosymbiont of Howardula sp. TaxID=2916816 RepID=UPI00217DE090|nr:inorganic diphosphatase [Wolbachia endosymbiont of Howardula sp.]UWI83270.1 inorganic diphosphatase [Wolbachia endosymbiont of Howardula sp.]